MLIPFTPIVRFRFKPEELEIKGEGSRFEWDKACPPVGSGVVRTSRKISPWRLGVLGSLTQGIGPGMIDRMQENPIKVISGIGFLTLSSLCLQKAYWEHKGKPEKAILNHWVFTWHMDLLKKTVTFLTPSVIQKQPTIRALANFCLEGNSMNQYLTLAHYL